MTPKLITHCLVVFISFPMRKLSCNLNAISEGCFFQNFLKNQNALFKHDANNTTGAVKIQENRIIVF